MTNMKIRPCFPLIMCARTHYTRYSSSFSDRVQPARGIHEEIAPQHHKKQCFGHKHIRAQQNGHKEDRGNHILFACQTLHRLPQAAKPKTVHTFSNCIRPFSIAFNPPTPTLKSVKRPYIPLVLSSVVSRAHASAEPTIGHEKQSSVTIAITNIKKNINYI